MEANQRTQSRTLSLRQGGRELGVSDALMYKMAQSGSIAGVPVIRVGKRLVLPRQAWEAMLAGEHE